MTELNIFTFSPRAGSSIMRRNALNCKKESDMNYKDFELARKKRKTEESHKAIKRKQMVRESRPRAKENYFAKNNPQLQGI